MSGILESVPVTGSTATAAAFNGINDTASFTSVPAFLSYPLNLLALPFRALSHAETFAFNTVPRHIAQLTGLNNINLNLWGGAAPTAGQHGLEGNAVAAAAGAAGEAAAGYGDSWFVTESMQTMRKVWGFFGYLTSIWSFACLIEALVLNRITIYASTRRHLRLGWERRLALRIIPIVLFVLQIMSLLRGIRCQSSPSFPELRYGNPRKPLSFDYATQGGALYTISSRLMPWESDSQACSAVNMERASGSPDIPYGSYSLLWPVFLVLCLSHFIETLVCALQGRPVMTETGMSIFEHSLAFAEAESMISKSIGLGLFGLAKRSPLAESTAAAGESASPLQLLSRAQILERMNVTPELLLIVLISCCNSLSSHLLDVFGKQSRYRLVNTTFWGICFMVAMLWGLENGPPISTETGVLKFPTVCIVGFIPHLLVLFGITSCFVIYGLALVITAFSLPLEEGQSVTFRERLALAHDNMQGSNQIRGIRVNGHEDFYTTLLRVGYVSLTAASEAVFLNEGKSVVAKQMTWLERERLAEFEESRRERESHRTPQNHFEGPLFDAVGFGGFDLPEQRREWQSGYKQEKKIEMPKSGSRQVRPQAELGGVGAVRASVRLRHCISFFRAIGLLILRWVVYGFGRLLERLGVHARPLWLKRLSGTHRNDAVPKRSSPSGPVDFWVLTDDGELELPDDHEFDVELEMQKQDRSRPGMWDAADERRLDERLYSWWKTGGSWGNQDHTPDYNPPMDDDDTTSVVSMSTCDSEAEWEDEDGLSDGRRTPTQSNPYPQYSCESTPAPEPLLDMSTFARLLDPRDRESREEARILAAHLNTGREPNRIMTRSQYKKQLEKENSRVLLSSRLHARASNVAAQGQPRKPSSEEEMEILEQLILSRRAEMASSSDPSTWESGATGLGPNGPPCVVCQTNPRSIITWPCRCLCICEDCRVSLAMNNFGSCVTCRQDVGGFMRLWVP
ncbi:Uncharacterized protein PECH_006593 [Penicillium ucsense]|uniref:Ubiquitin-protein ligase n=1 Tax=Penicillium ucsense TaxID=2839758 RepID=A0A8J8W904_9EURO|nr:Uncharacterized protein PECM_004008 [Penicillium ucsense]KAF7735488.1 Uncharacterized protein PECH_006593 [Penicillium ucsense]